MKNCQINIRLTEEIKNKLGEKAEEKGVTVSEYIRYLILKDLEK